MKRGFLNTPRAKKVIEEAHAAHTPPGPEPLPRVKPSPRHPTQDGGKEAVVTEDAMNVEMTAVGDPYVLLRAPAIAFAVRDSNDVAGVGPTQGIASSMSTSRPTWTVYKLDPHTLFCDSTNAELPSQAPKGKEKEISVDTDEEPDSYDYIESISILPPRPSPRRPGWGRHPDEEVLHTVPESHADPNTTRAVFRLWPRDPNGKCLMPSEQPRGTLSPDGYPWGATLYDLYVVQRIPMFPNAVSTMTGSGIWEAMKELGELDVAVSEIEWAKSEGKPRVEGVANTGVLIECMERRLNLRDVFGIGDVFEPDPEDKKAEHKGEHDGEHNKFSESIRKEVEQARRDAEEVEEFRARTLIIMRYERTKEQIKNYEPVIEVPLPPYPRRMTKVEDSHLYLSPAAKVGDGHHSVVYKGEWELPRDIFTRPKLCQRCFEESAGKEKQRLKDTGRWEKLLRAASWGPTGFTGRLPTQAEQDEASDPINLERNGEIIEREITFVVPPDTAPSYIFDMIEEGNIMDVFMKQKRNTRTLRVDLTGDRNSGDSAKDAYLTIIRLHSPFSYESQEACTHGSRGSAIPRTARFTVVAKLSIEDDTHLAREASNYQRFPERFFHHYNGYTIMAQLHTIVPVHAVVPQFYGYYTPEDGATQQTEEPYLSPILLLEHCGEPIEPEKLSIEDQDECASLLLRFQRAGWLHESVAPRNFLVQYGKPTEFPLMRGLHPKLSFRLIDFGRSRKFETAESKRAEEAEALRMFKKLYGKMNVTLSL
ncbi:hypothetical protein J3R82DRAFT_10046 [Butyriboletus roseoflavus]|nr:hypothetical protein J3R82DRAFT_10046 [Butyriboletus roseoflavus]